jgi:ABC-2 type transport system ATP-binding protein
MKRRLAICCALAAPSHVILLDEPMSGLDPAQRIDVRHLIQRLAEDAVVLLSTHLLQDVPEMASEIVILNRGRVAFSGDVERFLSVRTRKQGAPRSGLVGEMERRYLELIGNAE